jgi:hypothetical protein
MIIKDISMKNELENVSEIVKSQYYASLEMLKQAVIACPLSLWNDRTAKNEFWHIAYHALFYAHLYLQDSEKAFTPWSKHKNEYQFMGSLPWPPHASPKITEPYKKDEVLEYIKVCRKEIEDKVSDLNMGAQSGFHWLQFSKLELHFYNIRHIQHHAGALIDRLRSSTNVGIKWIAIKSDISE